MRTGSVDKPTSKRTSLQRGETNLLFGGILLIIFSAASLNALRSQVESHLADIARQSNFVALETNGRTESDKAKKQNKERKNPKTTSENHLPQSGLAVPVAVSSAPSVSSPLASSGSPQSSSPQPSGPSQPPPQEQRGGLGGVVDSLLCLPLICR